jgi:hypothetical protein
VNNVNISVLVNSTDFAKMLKDYDSLIPSFIETKDSITSDVIMAYIKNKIIFE